LSRRLLFFLLIFIFVLIPPFLAGTAGREAEFLCRGLETAGADFQKMELQGWAHFSAPPFSPAAKRDLLSRAVGVLAPGEGFLSPVREEGPVFSGLTWEKEGEGEAARLSLRWFRSGPEEQEEIYLLAGLSLDGDPSSWQEAFFRLEQVFRQEKLQPNYTISVIGTLPGPYSYNEQEEAARRIFRTLQVTAPAGIREGGLSSFTGYSPLLGNYVRDLAGNKINIQISLRYHAAEDRTYLYLGSPLISGAY
jgi:hypothetical protein